MQLCQRLRIRLPSSKLTEVWKGELFRWNSYFSIQYLTSAFLTVLFSNFCVFIKYLSMYNSLAIFEIVQDIYNTMWKNFSSDLYLAVGNSTHIWTFLDEARTSLAKATCIYFGWGKLRLVSRLNYQEKNLRKDSWHRSYCFYF